MADIRLPETARDLWTALDAIVSSTKHNLTIEQLAVLDIAAQVIQDKTTDKAVQAAAAITKNYWT
jgi:hypothetical protein